MENNHRLEPKPSCAAKLQNELPVPETAPPAVTEYEVDVLVAGSGYAGISAAVTAKKAGASVLIVDKGNLAFSSCSPWAQSYQFFNKDFGDDAEMQMEYTRKGGEYIANLDWYKVYLEESYDAFKELEEWKIYNPFPKASECEPDYYTLDQQFEYHQRFAQYDRRLAWRRLVRENEIPVVNRTMLTNVIIKDGTVAGAMGFDVPSGAVITFHAKSVILATGSGSYRNCGYPLSGNTFDGEYICYELGLPIVGREFEKPQGTNSIYPAANWNTYSWGWLECLHATAGASQFGVTLEQKLLKSMRDIGLVGKLPTLEKGIKPLQSAKEPGFAPRGNAVESLMPEEDARMVGNDTDKLPKRDIVGGCIGTGNWKNSGVFCGLDDFDGFTGIPGLYVAGDLYGCMMYGAAYTPGQGGSLPMSQIQGRRSARAAVKYAESLPKKSIDAETVRRVTEEILAPMNRETGFDPHWARDILHAAMAPFWVSLAKSEATLRSALLTVEMLRDKVLPLLIARNSHDLRLVHEVRHQICDAEMKLRSGLERRESRGTHYRTDYPYRDDKNFLCYITVRKGADGEMLLERVPVKPEWTGVLTEAYEKRYPVRFPGELEAKENGNGCLQN